MATVATQSYTQPISRSNSVASGLDSFGLANQASNLVRNGDLVGAERLHLQALDVKTRGFGTHSVQVAATQHALAEIQMRLGKMAEAERNLRSAVAIRGDSTKHNDLVDAARSRELLAQILEASGNLSDAKSVRLAGHPDAIACGNSKCPTQHYSTENLQHCGQCKSIFYCSEDCQVRDWRLRHRLYCRPT